ncbi:cytochrome c biogenesis protein CcdA/thiol-disulfide isomerase/thioredoxin [Actinokineospora baliensis]|uniref:cytochrome c biogenesis protein DipZ n=1 Tax=Actinokineospora baliensis TaxID=547056 RepID=UPI0027DC8633|nr:cytochrome c biogenesis protein DipZ [Actinokineospora baliensis]MBM7774283.1 cytochrome c biogenesis protein CcdA/thiol-disulfide isomerase/thioredoxin [Actinokineospora baliensis]
MPVLTLALIGLIGGAVTGISPCILPVLPVIFFSGAQSARQRAEGAVAVAEKPPSKWRPFQVIAGLVVSFSLVTLFGSLLLSVLGLPQDVLRWAGLVVLVLIGVGLIVPRFEHLLERPFSWIPQRNPDASKGGFALGLALGAVYVPCAGPVLAAITVAGSTGRIGWDTVVLTTTFAVGAATPLLVFALAGRRVAERVGAFRKRQRGIRITAGIVMITLAVGLVFNLPQLLQRALPDYTAPLQDKVNNSQPVRDALDLANLTNDQNKDLSKCTVGATELQSCGTAPDIRGIQQWVNGDPVELSQLRGKVVLLDFWAYSCINCQRSIPHVTAWDSAYRAAGLRVIGVHSPEYAFEKEPRNVIDAVAGFGIRYPVALDNSLSTWTNYRNRYWPAHYLIDATGTVRHIKFGEGEYDVTERMIRDLLREADPEVTLPAPTDTADTTPNTGEITRETFLGSTKQVNYAGTGRYTAGDAAFTFPAQQPDGSFALDGAWTLDTQNITPTSTEARVRLNYRAKEVRVVLSGTGTLTVNTPTGTRTISVSGTPRSYEVITTPSVQSGAITATASSGVALFSFTFG